MSYQGKGMRAASVGGGVSKPKVYSPRRVEERPTFYNVKEWAGPVGARAPEWVCSPAPKSEKLRVAPKCVARVSPLTKISQQLPMKLKKLT